MCENEVERACELLIDIHVCIKQFPQQYKGPPPNPTLENSPRKSAIGPCNYAPFARCLINAHNSGDFTDVFTESVDSVTVLDSVTFKLYAEMNLWGPRNGPEMSICLGTSIECADYCAWFDICSHMCDLNSTI